MHLFRNEYSYFCPVYLKFQLTEQSRRRAPSYAWHAQGTQDKALRLCANTQSAPAVQWSLHSQLCQTTPRLTEYGPQITYSGHTFYTAPIIACLLSVHSPGRGLLKAISLVRNLYLA
jgi:hypothetical protein